MTLWKAAAIVALLTAASDSANGQSLYAEAPYAGPVNYAHQAPPFRWGWFGAEHFYPTVKWHRGYNGDHYRWSRLRRY